MAAKRLCMNASLLLLLLAGCAARAPMRDTAGIEPPPVPREFRAAWVATVANIDWPTEPGLPPDVQRGEAVAILDRARAMNLNAIILQVRPQCDAFYPSELEPWSYFLTGEQGKPPEPFYDPLSFWIDEAHTRGLELHVWFNPYRAHHPNGEIGPDSVVRTKPGIALELDGGYWWLDPSRGETKEHSLAVLMDVVRRYDVDGVHFDDYFYPYPAYNNGADFPDDDSWNAYVADGGKLPRADWRRMHVNDFVQRVYRGIRREKPHVKFGMSPFGIWRPGYPRSILGFDQYDVLYADARLWLNEGWVDYFTPQLYWPIRQVAQSYPVLLGWWTRENREGRHLWPGLYTSRALDVRGVDEIVNQVMVTRGFMPDAPGTVHFSMRALMNNTAGLVDSLVARPYAVPALVPATPWLDDRPPEPPAIGADIDGKRGVVAWEPAPGGGDAFLWVVYIRQGDIWRHQILGPGERSFSFCIEPGTGADAQEDDTPPPAPVTHVAVSAVDRTGNESVRTVIPVRGAVR